MSNRSIKTVAVTGATGFVGREVVAELVRRGLAVRALVRDRKKASRVLPRASGGAAISLIEGDIHDGVSAKETVEGAQACIHLIGIIREERGGVTFHRMHVAATRVIVEACRDAGVQRYLHMSALGVCERGICEYQTTKWEAEQIVRRSGLDWTIFRPGLIHGENSELMQTATQWVKGEIAPWFFLPYFTRGVEERNVPLGGVSRVIPVVQPVAVEDVAIAFASAVEKSEAIGETYNLVGSEKISWPEMLHEIRDQVHGANDNLSAWGVPAELAAMKATAAQHVGLGALLPFDRGMALMGGQDSVAETEKVKAQLGLNARPFRASFRKYAGSL
ncbi:MAG: NAD(P)H-binding protein [Phycisphaeraceae bacterium]|nr:NAD(P)H-binding protein [Phycisphaeraceae bacterium]